ncbi:NitT/TauT family transport system permease protein [Natranaerovirga hydrolytica]|uniref:NitT/TauT family transport system permease protein n=1 Tax=Natranaerovirga hydrolytica TaxID=680378 RepID=A0A4R1ML54_9FIRM|nr:ABC transporter permease subunit [Natranaerovirga hydrolytica]TCK93225.1 NitT/TauT family transport system permease protein [Natranaerovirga hydrolytica]
MNLSKKDRRVVTLVWFIGVIVFLELLAFIMAYVVKDNMASAKIPFPHTILVVWIQNWESLVEAGLLTFSRAAMGFGIGASIGIVLAVIMSLSKTAEKIAFPYLIMSQMIPVLGLAPIIFNIVRDMNLSRIIIAAYITFFPVSVNMLSGLKAVDQEKKDLLYSIATSKYKVYKKLMFPFSMSYLFTGLKIAAPMAVTASILVDMLGSSGGIGVRILYALYSNTTDIFWASVATSALMGIISYYIIIFIEKLLLPWERNTSKKVGGKYE